MYIKIASLYARMSFDLLDDLPPECYDSSTTLALCIVSVLREASNRHFYMDVLSAFGGVRLYSRPLFMHKSRDLPLWALVHND